MCTGIGKNTTHTPSNLRIQIDDRILLFFSEKDKVGAVNGRSTCRSMATNTKRPSSGPSIPFLVIHPFLFISLQSQHRTTVCCVPVLPPSVGDNVGRQNEEEVDTWPKLVRLAFARSGKCELTFVLSSKTFSAVNFIVRLADEPSDLPLSNHN